jgi:hypothetical protein
MWRYAQRIVRFVAPLAFGSVTLCTAANPSVPLGLDAPLTTTFPLGLTGPGTTHKYYTTALDMSAPLLNRGSGDFMEAARLDARERIGLSQSVKLSEKESLAVEASVREHLSSASCKRAAFLRSGVVHDREEITAALVEGVFKSEGELALLLGGKSVGKSLLLAELARRTDIVGSDGAMRAVLYVDARRFNTNLAAGLEAALLGESKELSGEVLWTWLGNQVLSRRRPQEIRPEALASPTISSASVAAILRGIGIEAMLNFSKKATTVMEANLEMLDRVVTLARKQRLYLCLVVDEVNLAFPTPHRQTPLSPDEQRMLSETKVLLERLVMLTKQTNAMNVLLVSSEYSYPYRLRHENFFNTSNISATLFAGEVPPAEMRTLLRDTWDLGPRLSDVFLAFYGGHIYMASRALPKLAAQLDAFKCTSVAPDGAVGAIAAALGSGRSSSEKNKARALLRSAAQRGFAPVQEEGDASAQALARANLGGLVNSEGLVVGLPESVRGKSKFGFVPSSQFLVRYSHTDSYPACLCLVHPGVALLPPPTPPPLFTLHIHTHTHSAAQSNCQGSL